MKTTSIKVGDCAVIKRSDGQLKAAVITVIDKHGWVQFEGDQLHKRHATGCCRSPNSLGSTWWPHKILNEQGEMIDE